MPHVSELLEVEPLSQGGPQTTTVPQPSPISPHETPTWAQVTGTQVQHPPSLLDDELGVLAPDVLAVDEHAPQSRRPPQPSPATPHGRPCSPHVKGTHVPPLAAVVEAALECLECPARVVVARLSDEVDDGSRLDVAGAEDATLAVADGVSGARLDSATTTTTVEVDAAPTEPARELALDVEVLSWSGATSPTPATAPPHAA